MTETITDSFCERCGTRYAFEASAKPRRARLGRVRVLTRSVTTFISNDGMPMAEALAAARNDEERADLARQLDAFHKTFNFCMGCRQYTCASCWNATTGECLTCSPDLTREVLPAPFPDLPISGPGGTNGEAVDAAEAAAAMAWPSIDLERGEAGPAGEPANEPVAVEPVAEPVEPPVEPVELVVFEPPVELVVFEPPVEPVELVAVEPVVFEPPVEPVEPVAVEPVDVTAVAEAAPALARAADAEDLTAAELAEIEGALAVEHPGAAPLAADDDASGSSAAPASEQTDPMAAGRDRTRGLLRRFRPAAAVAVATGAPEPAASTTAEALAGRAEPAEPTAEPIERVAAEEAVEPAAPIAAETVAAEAVADLIEPEPAAPELAAPEPVAAEPEPVAAEPEPVAAEPEPVAATRTDAVEQPTWRMVAPDAAGPSAPETSSADAPQAPPPAWPDSPAWPSTPARVPPRTPSADAAPWAARLSLSRPETAGIWAASSREVLGGPAGQASPAATAVQACVSCGLSLSATARFCRRCGSRQG